VIGQLGGDTDTQWDVALMVAPSPKRSSEQAKPHYETYLRQGVHLDVEREEGRGTLPSATYSSGVDNHA
jgi:hypothetical protein